MSEPIDPVRIFLDTWAEMIAPGGAFAMDEIEALGRPTRVFASAPPNMRAVWENTFGHADRTYLVFEDEHLTYGEVHTKARALAHYLASECGIGAGSRVGLSMRNYPEWVITYWAVVSLGATVVGLNAWWTSNEMDFALRETRPTVLIVDGERLERLLPILDGLRDDHELAVIATRVDGELPDTVAAWDEAISGPAPDVIPPVDIDPDADVTIFFTSGTTGFPKGAQITHRGSVHNLMHMIFMAMVGSASQSKVAAARGNNATKALLTEPVFLAPTPLFHVTALNCLLHPLTMAGGTVVLMHKWDAARALELIEREQVTTLSGVPTMSREILAHPDWETRDTSSLVGLAGGGAPVPPDLVEKIGASLPHGGASTGYGLTETSGIVTANSAACYVAKPASCGPVVPTLDAKLVDDDGNELPVDPQSIGNLWVRGSVVVKGYLGRPEATAESIVDGWFDTGDIARIDEDGFVFLVDRAKDMVLRGGENVYCSEVEAAIYAHDQIAEVAVFGIPDERLGEAVAAVIVPVEGADVDIEELKAFVAERIARHKVPQVIELRLEPLPTSATGKFLKRDLRTEYFPTA